MSSPATAQARPSLTRGEEPTDTGVVQSPVEKNRCLTKQMRVATVAAFPFSVQSCFPPSGRVCGRSLWRRAAVAVRSRADLTPFAPPATNGRAVGIAYRVVPLTAHRLARRAADVFG